MSALANETVVRQACQVIWTDGEVERMGEFYAEGFRADYPMAGWGEGLDGAQQFAAAIRSGFPDYSEEIEQLIDAGEHIVVVLRIRGTHSGVYAGMPPTGRSVDFRDVSICRVQDGRIVSQRGLSDNLTLLAQLGLVTLPKLG